MLDNGTGNGVGLGKIMKMKKLLTMDHRTRRSGLTLVSCPIALSFDYSCGWIPQLSRSMHGVACSSFYSRLALQMGHQDLPCTSPWCGPGIWCLACSYYCGLDYDQSHLITVCKASELKEGGIRFMNTLFVYFVP